MKKIGGSGQTGVDQAALDAESAPPIEDRMDESAARSNRMTRIPCAADARLLLYNLESDPLFGEMLNEVLPDEADHLAYLNHLAWQVRS